MRKTAWTLVVAISLIPTAAIAANGDDTSLNPDQLSWARWHGRLSLGTTAVGWRLGFENPALRPSAASLMGDYYFGRALAGVGQLGGFRASSGLIIGPRRMLGTGQPALTATNAFSIGNRLFGQPASPYTVDAPSDNATLPYLGVGYTGLSVRSAWSFSADLGLVAQSPGSAARIGRVFGGGQSLDDVVRDMRMAPLLQLGVSYAF